MTIEGLGKKFQDARLARGLTLDEAARLTKIRPSRLAEIEADDFSQFPSLAYAKGFLQIYGKFLDVDVTPYLDVFETSQQMTVDGYSYLQDQPAPKPRRIRARPRAPVVRRQRSGDRSSPFPLLIAVGVIVVGFVLMRLILNIQRIAPHQMVGVPQPTASQSFPAQTQPAQAPAASVAPPPAAIVEAPKKSPAVATAAPSLAPSTPPPTAIVEVPKKAASPVATVAPSIPVPNAFVPAFANANAAAKASVAPKEPEVRRAEPVRPEDLAKAGATETNQKPSEAEGPNRIAIKPLKKTYIKVVVDNGSLQPAFERWISPTDGTVEFRGQKIAVRVLDRDAIQIKKNGKPVGDDDDDVTVE
ncbi:MAG TPA: helix-turn-helix domain-containing protein [Chthoniobacterales bacterium]|jgi:cytoskeletal protein RodZ|nr:helix-turn-helix domain-containing protein [Chthoniobacterales bacterium]